MRRIDLFFVFVAAALFFSPASGLADTPPEAADAASLDAAEVGDVPSELANDPDEDLASDAARGIVADIAGDVSDAAAGDSPDDPTSESEAANSEAMLDVPASPASDDSDALLATSLEASVEASSEVVSQVEPELLIKAEIELTDSSDGLQTSRGIVLGPQGIDDQGRTGRLHTVSSGDTLWDLAAAYLGTPWVWPSVWIDNDDIDNPHLITPGDRIWITANEMRVVSAAEGESFLEPIAMESGIETLPETEDGTLEAIGLADWAEPPAALEAAADDPSSLEAFPISDSAEGSESTSSGKQITISRRDAMGFVSSEDLAGASTIVDSSVERTFLAAGDPVVLGLGEGDVQVGDQFTIFRVIENVRDVETNRILGQHIDVLGWVEVRELTGDTSIGEIRTSYSEMRRGARVMPRSMPLRKVTARRTPDAIAGKIVFLPSERTVMADGGYVYLNRGEFHGVEIGSELEVFEPGMIVNDRSRRVDVRTPDHSVANLVVVSVTESSSVAFVLDSSRELAVGDDVRPRSSQLARR